MVTRRKVLRLAILAAVIYCVSILRSQPSSWQAGPFTKHNSNPIISPRGLGWESKAVYNPAAWTDGSVVWMLYRAENRPNASVPNDRSVSRVGLARSIDGIHFEREREPVLFPTEPYEFPGGVEDPRVVRVGQLFYLTYTAYDGKLARLCVATSSDLRLWRKHGVLFPSLGWTKSGAILTRPIRNLYWMYFGDTSLYLAYSADLIKWTALQQPVLQPRPGNWDSRLVEPGPPPMVTRDGIVLIYNGANNQLVYGVGQALFALDDPSRCLARTDQPFLRPEAHLEKHGQVRNVVFAEGLVAFNGKLMLYFGMGDSGLGVATAPLAP
mmetsp:Transcript_12601/g.21765  ORF Transcript_12601/g.21765 Transcript_12601/m.21765 type:complete len:325 (-) Transcript_12601:269-1243(-)